jgi:hypothetical protein
MAVRLAGSSKFLSSIVVCHPAPLSESEIKAIKVGLPFLFLTKLNIREDSRLVGMR